METYLAPALDWRMLRQDWFVDGALKGQTIAVQVIKGEPSADL